MAIPPLDLAHHRPTSNGAGSSESSELSVLAIDAPGPSSSSKPSGKGKKRISEATVPEQTKKAKKAKVEATSAVEAIGQEEKKEKGTYCHQCHRICETDAFLRCTKPKQYNKNGATRPCNMVFCDRDILRHYGETPQDIRTPGYEWTCPDCKGECNNSHCRKKRGLEPLGQAKPRESGISVASKATPKKKVPAKSDGSSHAHSNGKQKSTSDTSSLSDAPDEWAEFAQPSGKTKKEKKLEKPQHTSGNGESAVKVKKKKEAGESKAGKAKGAEIGDKKGVEKGKGTGKGEIKASKVKTKTTPESKPSTPKTKAEVKEKKPKPKPIKKPDPPVEPPVFEKVDTRLGKGEVEQRLMLREYFNRFKGVLSLPERSLPPLDDFDRPVTEASVRVFAGAMLDLFKEEVEASQDEELLGTLSQHREELRYYADLARFANIYNALVEPLNFPEVTEEATFPLAGPSRRGASRIPQPEEVVRMLLSMAERTLSTRQIRSDLDWAAPENEARRVHAREQKKANEAWEAKKKKLAEGRLQSSTAAATKANKEMYASEQKDHHMTIALSNVNLNAALGRRALRHEPLGVDLDGRVYYCLSIRPIDEDTRPPVGWASGLLVWGKGAARTDAVMAEDDLPPAVERWSHFGKSHSVRELIKWISWRNKKAMERPTKSPAKAKSTPNGKSPLTPKSAKQSTLSMLLSAKSTTKRHPTLEVVIPTRRSSDNDDDSDLSSLSSDDLLDQIAPIGYTKSWALMDEEGKALCARLVEVAEWLEVLEWKGMGEVR